MYRKLNRDYYKNTQQRSDMIKIMERHLATWTEDLHQQNQSPSNHTQYLFYEDKIIKVNNKLYY